MTTALDALADTGPTQHSFAMACKYDRHRRRPLLLVVILLCMIGAALWFMSELQFRVLQPRAVQQRLFGTQIAAWSALRHASNGCCAMDSSGILEWTYSIPADQAADLAKRCRLPDGSPRPFTNLNQPYFEEHFGRCVVARYFDGEAAEEASAEVSGTSLKIRLFYIDPDLIDQNFVVATAK